MEVLAICLILGVIIFVSVIIHLSKDRNRLYQEIVELGETLRRKDEDHNKLLDDKVKRIIEIQEEKSLSINELQTALLEAEKRRGKIIDKRVQSKFQEWCDNELENLKKQINDLALKNAKAQLREWKDEQEFIIRSDASKRSRSVRIGNSLQHLAPYLPEFDCDIQDVRFIGNPIDFIVFDGLCDGKLKEILFVEVKTGSHSTLNNNEIQIKEFVEKKKVKWLEIYIPTLGEVKTSTGRRNLKS